MLRLLVLMLAAVGATKEKMLHWEETRAWTGERPYDYIYPNEYK